MLIEVIIVSGSNLVENGRMRKLFAAYAAGSLGALVITLLGLFLSGFGLTVAGSTLVAPNEAVIYRHLVWGGVFGFAFPLLGLTRLRHLHGALLLSLIPSAAQLLYLFPNNGMGWFGLSRGFMTPVVAVLLNIVWGWVTVFGASRTMT
jgi:hypothetical protein